MSSRVGRWGFAAGLVLYLAAVLVASAAPGPRAWGLHLLGFLPPAASAFILCLLAVAIATAAAGALDRSATSEAASTDPPVEQPRGWLLAVCLMVYAALLWLLRARTQFLGDGTYWMARLRTGHVPAPAEPLSQAVWEAASAALRHMAAPVASLELVSIACGLVAAILCWRIALLIGATRGERIAAFLLLLTMGSSQLFFGYLESYPVGITFLLGYLCVGLTAARNRSAPVALALAYAGALASHMIALYLIPSFLYLVLRADASRARKGALVLLALGLAALVMILLGSTPSTWIHTFDLAARAARTGSPISEFSKPYGILSADHAADMLNEILLVLPIPLLLLLSAGLSRERLEQEDGRERTFLFLAAACGVVSFALLVLPVAAAQDWDLMSMLLVPLGVLGVWMGKSIFGGAGRPVRVAAVAAGLAALFSFVLVNASERSALRRYETLVGPGARISSFGRWYAWESLAQYYRHHHRYDLAMGYVERLIRSAPDNPRYWGMAGETLNGMGRYAEAVPLLRESLRRNPERAPARTNLGIAYSALGRYPEALVEFREAVRLDGDNADYRHNLGLAFWNAGKPDSARATWTALLARWPGYARTRQAMAKYFGTG
jgi:tetratricopeptide (TPR) repeat protein